MARVVLLTFLLLHAGLASAQEVLTLDRAIQQAVAGNPGLRGARAAVDQADAGKSVARAGYFPTVSFNETWQRGNQPVFVFGSLLSSRQFSSSNFAIDALNRPTPVGFFHGAVAVEQVLFDGGRQRAGVDTAGERHTMASASADEAAADLALAVTRTYGRLLASRAAAHAAESAMATAGEDSARARRRRDVGLATDAEVLALAVHLADAQQRAIQASSDTAIARADLNRLMGRPVTDEYDVQEPLALPMRPADLPALIAEAEGSRAELRRADAEVEMARVAVREARAAWWPRVAAQAGYELNGTHFTDRASAWVVGADLRWALSMGGAQAAGQRAAAAALARAEAARDDVRAAVQLEVVTALRQMESARARETVARSAVEQAREAQRIVRDRYDAGLAAVSDVLRAATAVLDAETQRTSALVGALTSEAMISHAVGRRP